jgi:hypothetical protein
MGRIFLTEKKEKEKKKLPMPSLIIELFVKQVRKKVIQSYLNRLRLCLMK